MFNREKNHTELVFPLSNRPKETATATTQQQTTRQLNAAAWCLLMRTTITNGHGKIATVCPLARSTAGTTRLWWRRTTRTPTRILTSLIVTEDPREATARTPGTGFELWPALPWHEENCYTHLDCNNLVSMCSTSLSLWPWRLPNEHLNLKKEKKKESCSCFDVSKTREWAGFESSTKAEKWCIKGKAKTGPDLNMPQMWLVSEVH